MSSLSALFLSYVRNTIECCRGDEYLLSNLEVSTAWTVRGFNEILAC